MGTGYIDSTGFINISNSNGSNTTGYIDSTGFINISNPNSGGLTMTPLEWDVKDWKLKNGDVYTGHVKKAEAGTKGFAHGKGKLTFADGGFYEGDFAFNKFHGKGKMIWPNGNVYEGDWVKGNRHGIGKVIWTKPNVCKEFEGGFFENRLKGQGKYLLSDGRIFEGDFDGNGSATGKMTYPNGKTENGVWVDKDDSFTAK